MDSVDVIILPCKGVYNIHSGLNIEWVRVHKGARNANYPEPKMGPVILHSSKKFPGPRARFAGIVDLVHYEELCVDAIDVVCLLFPVSTLFVRAGSSLLG